MPPLDTRRFTGPEGSFDYRIVAKKKEEAKKDSSKRSDGRGNDESRPLFLRIGVISKAKGSAYIEQGNTKVMVGVYGPREIARRSDFTMKGQVTCEFKFAPFACTTRRGHQADKEELELGLVLRECLESTVRMTLYPKSCIDVFVTVLEDGGGTLAAAITAAGLALSDAQIALYDNVVGTSVTISKDQVLVDPSSDEEYTTSHKRESVEGNVTLGYLNTLDQVVCFVSQGLFSESQLSDGLTAAVTQAGKQLPFIQKCQLDSLKRKKKKEP